MVLPGEIPDCPDYMVPHMHRMGANLSRVDSLLDLYDYLTRLLKIHEDAVSQGKAERMPLAPAKARTGAFEGFVDEVSYFPRRLF